MKYLQYFDKDFFKFFFGFLVVVAVSMFMIFFTNAYHCKALEQQGNVIEADPDTMC